MYSYPLSLWIWCHLSLFPKSPKSVIPKTAACPVIPYPKNPNSASQIKDNCYYWKNKYHALYGKYYSFKKICYVKTEQVIYSLFSLSREKEIETKNVTLCHGIQTRSRGHDRKIWRFIKGTVGGCKISVTNLWKTWNRFFQRCRVKDINCL